MKLTKKEMKVAGIRESMQNLVQRDYANYVDESKKEDSGILISAKGLLMGAVVYETSRPKLINKQNLWEKYKVVYSADTYLGQGFLYWFYKLIIIVGWFVFAAAVILVFWSLGEKINGVIK
jgi:hypothetical protein